MYCSVGSILERNWRGKCYTWLIVQKKKHYEQFLYFRHGIKVAGFSGDGDIRVLNSMRYNSNFNSDINENKWFSVDSNICFLQDIVHIGTKLRNRLLDLVIFLLIGNKVVSVGHLKILINSVPKAVHGLVYSDICPDDRQNYNSLVKVMEPRVRKALAAYVLGSEGTIEFIKICDEITSSLYDDNLSPLEIQLGQINRD